MTLEIKVKEPASQHKTRKNPASEGSAYNSSYPTPSLQQSYQDMCWTLLDTPSPPQTEASLPPSRLHLDPWSQRPVPVLYVPKDPRTFTFASTSNSQVSQLVLSYPKLGSTHSILHQRLTRCQPMQTPNAYQESSTAGRRCTWPCLRSSMQHMLVHVTHATKLLHV